VVPAGMKHALIVALLTLWSFEAAAQTRISAAEPNAPSVRDQIKAVRAKDKEDEAKDKNEPRLWDRDTNGKRPWEETPRERPR